MNDKEVNTVDEAHMKARATRERNREAQARRYEEQAAMLRVARQALQRVLESEEATPAEILEAARMLVEIGK